MGSPMQTGRKVFAPERTGEAVDRVSSVRDFALVLSGGGATGVAWETGLLAALLEADVELADADSVIGTSAGAVVGRRVAAGVAGGDLVAALENGPSLADLASADKLAEGLFRFLELLGEGIDAAGAVRAGAAAQEQTVIGGDAWLAFVDELVESDAWPETLQVTAVDADTGEREVFTAGSDVPLVPAIAASLAIPCTIGPVELDDRVFIDGGARSATHADLAVTANKALVVTCLPGEAPLLAHVNLNARTEEEIAGLRAADVAVQLVRPDDKAVEAMGINALDMAAVPASLDAGREQGLRLAEEISDFLG